MLAKLNTQADGTSVTLPAPIKVFGLETRRVFVFRDGFEQTYRSYFDGLSSQQLIKAASLTFSKARKAYGRTTKLGVLSMDTDAGAVTLTCVVDVGG